MEELLLAAELKQQLDALRPLDPEQENKVMQKFRLDWNYHSNNLEGNSLTYGETKALIMFGITAQGKPLKDHSEIKEHNEAIDWVIELVKGDRPLSESFIRELNRLLIKDFYEEKIKKGIKIPSYKSAPNHVITVTGETFYFATPEETPALMADLMDWYNERIESEDLNPILLAAEFHHKFISIHPFDDGNGRTARIVMNFILMKYGYPPVIIKTEDKSNYLAALQLADSGQIEIFIQYIAKNLVHSLEIMLAGARGESIEEPDDIDKEIALLEKRLSGFGNKIEKEKSDETIKSIITNSITQLIEEVNSKLKKFDDYYAQKSYSVKINNDSFSDINGIIFSPAINKVEITFYRSRIKQTGLESFNFRYVIGFNFYDKLLFSVLTQRMHSYNRNYYDLTEQEITTLANKVIQFHNTQLSLALDTKGKS